MAEIYIQDVMKDIVSKITYNNLPVYYTFGHYIELANKLSNKNRNNEKYPLFGLILDITETETNKDGIYKSYDFNMIIAFNSKDDYTAEKRLTNVFKPILQPLYRTLLDEMKASNKFNIEMDFIDHTKTDRYFLGSSDKNQNRLNDYVDAIEISFKNLKLFTQFNC